jgi:SAM-dependent methyltransferase
MALSFKAAGRFVANASDARVASWRQRTLDFASPHARLHLLVRIVRELRPDRCTLLDVGCGPAALKQLLPHTVEYFGVDIVPHVIHAQRDAAHFEVTDLETAEACFDGTRFDIVVCSGVFEYIHAREHFLQFLRRSLAEGGTLILTFTNHAHYLDVVKHKQYRDPHVNFMSISELVGYLPAHGFRIRRHTAMTVAHGEWPLLRRFIAFPLCILNRTYAFVCQPA